MSLQAGVVVMISGPTKITKTLFDTHYAPLIKVRVDEGASFVIGGAEGVDYFAQELLFELGAKYVTVFDKGTQDNCRHKDVFSHQNGFATYPERDRHMTSISNTDIAFVSMSGGGSGTMQNIFRRKYGADMARELTELIRACTKLEE